MRTVFFRQMMIVVVAVLTISRFAGAVDLMDSYRNALGIDPSFLAAKEAHEAGREKAIQGNALLKPNVTLSGDYKRLRIETSTDLPGFLSNVIPTESSGNLYGYSVTVKQPIYRTEAWATAKQLRQQSGLAELSYRDAQQEIILRVAKTYFGVLLAQDTSRLVAAQKAAIKEQLDNAQARFDAGRAKITDVREAQARYDAILASEIKADSELTMRRAEYREATGEAADHLVEVRTEFAPLPPEPADLGFWQNRGLDNNPQVLAKQRQLVIAVAEVNKFRLFSQPTLDLFASYSDDRQSGDLSPIVYPDRSQSTVVGFQLSIPLYSGGSILSQLREAQAKRREAIQDLEAAKRDIRLQVQEAFLAVSTGASQVKALEQALESAKTSVEAATIGLEVGVRTTLDVLDVQQRYYSTQRDLAQARYNYLLGRLQLAAAIGQLAEDEVKTVNAYLAQ